MSRHEPSRWSSACRALLVTAAEAGVPVDQRVTESFALGKPGLRRLIEAHP